MAVITRSNAVLETATPPPNALIGGYLAGEAIAALDALYMKASDGTLRKCDATADDEKARCIGFAAQARSAGKGVTIMRFVVVKYAVAGLVPGAFLYLSTTPGALQTTAPAGNPNPVAQVLDDESIYIFGSVGYAPGLAELSTLAGNIPTAAVADEATANGSDPATTQALANALKVKVNDLLAKLRTAGIITP